MTDEQSYRIGPRVAYVGAVLGAGEADGQGDAYFVALLPDGPVSVLQHSAALIWQAVVDGGAVGAIIRRVAQLGRLTTDEVAADTTAFLEELTTRGLVERSVRRRPADGP